MIVHAVMSGYTILNCMYRQVVCTMSIIAIITFVYVTSVIDRGRYIQLMYSVFYMCRYLDVSFISYIVSEVTHGYQLKEDKDLFSEKQRRITTFMKTPRELEKVCSKP